MVNGRVTQEIELTETLADMESRACNALVHVLNCVPYSGNLGVNAFE